jgi:uncharacterized integral membrane protein
MRRNKTHINEIQKKAIYKIWIIIVIIIIIIIIIIILFINTSQIYHWEMRGVIYVYLQWIQWVF